MTKIKLCGLSRIHDIEVANRLSPDYVGFIFAKKSKRFVSYDKITGLKLKLSPQIKSVGVFVDENIDIIENLAKNSLIDVIQLHGNEDESYIRALRLRTGVPIIKAFRIDTADDVEKASNSTANHVLLDAGEGGTGNSFDWNLLKNIQIPYFLAGGLNPENVSDAIRKLKPYGVDVSSGIETDGLKDSDKMIRFVESVRKENNHDKS